MFKRTNAGDNLSGVNVIKLVISISIIISLSIALMWHLSCKILRYTRTIISRYTILAVIISLIQTTARDANDDRHSPKLSDGQD